MAIARPTWRAAPVTAQLAQLKVFRKSQSSLATFLGSVAKG
jgi:hypothetical protein